MKVNDILKPYRLIEKAKEQFAEDLLYEGLITSYPMLKVIELTNVKFKCHTSKLKKDKNIYYNCFAVNGEINKFDFENFLKLLNQCGWYIALIKFYSSSNKEVSSLKKDISLENILQFSKNVQYFNLKVEAKYDVQIDKKHWPQYLYCIAPLKVKSKILKNGLIPKAGKNLDNQPERIYLGLDKNTLIKEMLPQLKINDNRYDDGAIILTLDSSKFPDNVRLFDDINWPDEAVYTIVNISPNSIVEIEEI